MKRYNYELSVKICGNKIPEYGSCGRTYIRGENDREFSLYFKNNTASRVLARFSVDGLSVLNGKDVTNDKGGYICHAYSSIEIAGWRTSLDEIRKFQFTTKDKSYAGKKGDTTNCGVIGVQVYDEKYNPPPIYDDPWYSEPHPIDPWPRLPYFPSPRPQPPYRPYYPYDKKVRWDDSLGRSSSWYHSSDYSHKLYACSAGEVTDYNLGTKFGYARKDSVRKVDFDIGNLITTLEIYYTDKDGLQKAGIDLEKWKPLVVHPKAFGGFCQPPPGED